MPDLGLPITVPTELPDDLADVIYPADTLHLELNAGRPTARAFIVPDLTQLPVGARVTGGELVLPVNTEATSGNRAVESAHFDACLTTSAVTDGQHGRLSRAPTYDCEAALSSATYRPKTGDFVVDLGPFITQWYAGEPNFGVALLPTAVDDPADAATTATTWHVALNGSRIATGEPSVSLLRYEVADTTEPTDEPTTDPDGDGSSSATGGGIVTPTPPIAQAPAVAPTTPEPAAPAEALAPAPYALLTSPWYTYRGVIFLPLAFLVTLSLTGRSLTRPLGRLAIARRA
ncbi:MAG: hypothetical protein F2667_04820 [Actinobacteria bacterium]|uniref:Unannotated protein n=1 Tax=freshwater metagenome TaxID=449393 RepID=A0A6J6PU93_9ZZZZ|nr:hypothetical protein [Actinomycetota bacterium]